MSVHSSEDYMKILGTRALPAINELEKSLTNSESSQVIQKKLGEAKNLINQSLEEIESKCNELIMKRTLGDDIYKLAKKVIESEKKEDTLKYLRDTKDCIQTKINSK